MDIRVEKNARKINAEEVKMSEFVVKVWSHFFRNARYIGLCLPPMYLDKACVPTFAYHNIINTYNEHTGSLFSQHLRYL